MLKRTEKSRCSNLGNTAPQGINIIADTGNMPEFVRSLIEIGAREEEMIEKLRVAVGEEDREKVYRIAREFFNG